MMSSPDILIVGGGAAGIAAAVAASRAGASVVLLERYSFLGGKATGAEVGTICGLHKFSKDPSSEYITTGFAKEFAELLKNKSNTEPLHNPHGLHYLPYKPFDFKCLSDELIAANHIDVFFHSTVCDVKIDADKITTVNAIVFDRKISFTPRAVIDCSGESIVSALAKLPLIESNEYQAAAQVFTMENIGDTDEAKLGMVLIRSIQTAVENKKLEQHFDRVTVVPGSLKNNSVQLKIGIPHVISNDDNKSGALEILSRQLIDTLSSYLIKEVALFKDSHLGAVAIEAGIRVGRRSKGKYTLTEEDVLSCRKFEDAAANGAWPIEIWGQDKRVKMKYFAENDFYQIPKDCLRSDKVENLFFAGRIISADEGAIASARVIGICLQTGYAAGEMAAYRFK